MNIIAVSILLLCGFVHVNANASSVMEIERLAASEANCTKDQPCIISITRDKEKYVVKVNRSTLITPEGVLKFRPGSVIYYIYKSDGSLEKRSPTT
jgi:hypothetical protein